MPDPLPVPEPRRSGRAIAIRLLTIAFSAALLYLLYRSLDARGVGRVLGQAHTAWLTVSLAMLVPITVMRAARFLWLAPDGTLSGLGEATRMTLVASAVNMFLPAKAGDFAKSLIMTRRDGTAIGVSAAVVIFERLADVLGLVMWCLGGYMLVKPIAPLLPRATWAGLAGIGVIAVLALVSAPFGEWLGGIVRRTFTKGRGTTLLRELFEGWRTLHERLRGRRLLLVLYSVGLWFVQLLQIWLFTLVVGAQVPPAVSATLSAIALLIGQVPVTFGGIGARDVALVLLFSAYMTPEQAAAVGILTASRNLLPPLAALPFLRRYVTLLISRG